MIHFFQLIFQDRYSQSKEEQMLKPSISCLPAVLVKSAAIVMMLMAALPASAQQTSTPCTADFAKHCSSVTPGGGRLLKCYEEKKNLMSAACVAYAESAKANGAVVSQACSQEISWGCTSEKGDPLGMLQCLQGQYVRLSPECVQKLNEFKSRFPQPAQ
jgi:hypothetical protein